MACSASSVSTSRWRSVGSGPNHWSPRRSLMVSALAPSACQLDRAVAQDGEHLARGAGLELGRLAVEERRVLEERGRDELRVALGDGPRDAAAERVADQDGGAADLAQDGDDVAGVVIDPVGARRLVGVAVPALVDAQDAAAEEDLRAAARRRRGGCRTRRAGRPRAGRRAARRPARSG